MPPATKKAAPAKKAAAAKKAPAAKKVAAETNGRALAKEQNLELGQTIKALRDDEEKSWADISAEVGIGQGKAMLLYNYASVTPKDRIKVTGDAEADGALIVTARANGLSWGQIMARTGLGEGKLRTMFEAASGESSLGNRIGRGGRYPSGEARPTAPAKKVPAKKAAAKKAASTEKVAGVTLPPPGTSLSDFTLPQLQKRLNGKTITVAKAGGGTEKIGVKNISRLKDGEVVFTDNTGKSRTVLTAHIKAASK